MTTNFHEEMSGIFSKQRCREVKAPPATVKQNVEEAPPQIEEVEKEVKKIVPVTLYKIHKRSLPVSTDIPILFHLTYEEAKRWHTRLRPKLMKYEVDGIREVTYYDIVKSGVAYSVFDNEVDVVNKDLEGLDA